MAGMKQLTRVFRQQDLSDIIEIQFCDKVERNLPFVTVCKICVCGGVCVWKGGVHVSVCVFGGEACQQYIRERYHILNLGVAKEIS